MSSEQEPIDIKPAVSDIHVNITQKLIIITEDKLHICLSKNLEKIEKKRVWIAPLGILITILVTLLTSAFQDFIIPAATWHAIFIIVAFLSFIWLLISLNQARQSIEIEDVIGELKQSSERQP